MSGQRAEAEQANTSDDIEELRAAYERECAARARAERLLAEARAAEASQRAAVERLSETVRMNELFGAALGHDLRNPLWGILTAASIARKTAPPELQRHLGVIQTTGKRMARLIEQLLEFSRIRAGADLPLVPTPLDLRSIVDQVVQELAVFDAERRVALALSGDTRGTWDGDRLAQVLSNLIRNALQHGLDGPVRVMIDGSHQSVVCVRVHNAGMISESVRPRLFDPWATAAARTGGTGLGLFIARHFAQAHGGEMVLESTTDAGTTFALSIPRDVRETRVSRVIPAVGREDR
jgi:signal transduction histidine kinase